LAALLLQAVHLPKLHLTVQVSSTANTSTYGVRSTSELRQAAAAQTQGVQANITFKDLSQIPCPDTISFRFLTCPLCYLGGQGGQRATQPVVDLCRPSGKVPSPWKTSGSAINGSWSKALICAMRFLQLQHGGFSIAGIGGAQSREALDGRGCQVRSSQTDIFKTVESCSHRAVRCMTFSVII
jgi:hypothetical protein